MDYKDYVRKECFIIYSDIPVDSSVTDQETKEYSVFKVYGKVVSAKTDAVAVRDENGGIHRISDKMIQKYYYPYFEETFVSPYTRKYVIERECEE